MFIGRLDSGNIRDILDNLSDGIQIYDSEGYLVYCNSKCEIIDDIKGQKSIGRHVTSIYPPDADSERTVMKVLRTGIPILGKEQSYVNYFGRRLTAVTSTLPLLQQGKIIGVMEVTRSLTENRELAETVERLKLETEAWKASSGVGEMLARYRDVRGDAGDVTVSVSAALPDEFGGYEQAMEIFERGIIEKALVQSSYNVSACAKLLALPRQTLQYKIKKLGIELHKEQYGEV